MKSKELFMSLWNLFLKIKILVRVLIENIRDLKCHKVYYPGGQWMNI